MIPLWFSTILLCAIPGISPDEFERLHAELQPPDDELWSSIPWEISIQRALRRAEREEKPLVMWVMNGNPCGAT